MKNHWKSAAAAAAAAAGVCVAGAPCAAMPVVEMVVAGAVHEVALVEHPGTLDFIARLPMRVRFEDFGTTERIAYLNSKLNTTGAPDRADPKKGDFAYYMPWGNLAVFVKDFRPSEGLMPMGRVTPEGLDVIRHSGDAEVLFRVKKQQ